MKISVIHQKILRSFVFEVECCLESEGFSISFGMLSSAPEGVSP